MDENEYLEGTEQCWRDAVWMRVLGESGLALVRRAAGIEEAGGGGGGDGVVLVVAASLFGSGGRLLFERGWGW